MAVKVMLIKGTDVKEGVVGFSWTTFFFGFFVPLFRGDFSTAGLMFLGTILIGIIGTMTFGLLSPLLLIFPFKYNRYYTEKFINQGFKPFREEDEIILRNYGYII